MKTNRLLAIAGFAFSVLGAGAGQAGYEIWDPSVSTCTGLNCSSIFFGGTVLNSAGLSTARWEAAVYANAGECLRLDQTFAFNGVGAPNTPDDEMVVVAPNGTVYRNDDFGGTLRPRVAFVARSRGWYYVTIARFSGAPSPEHDFYIAYGRYSPGTNPNCASPTAPFSAQEAASKPSVGVGAAPSPDGPTGPGNR